MQALRIPIRVRERRGIARFREPVRLGVPLLQGTLTERELGRALVRLSSADGSAFVAQARPLAEWPDGSIKWLLLDSVVSIPSSSELDLTLEILAGDSGLPKPDLEVAQFPDRIEIDTGALRAIVARTGTAIVSSARVGSVEMLQSPGCQIALIGGTGKRLLLEVLDLTVQQLGPARVTLCLTGRWRTHGEECQLEAQLWLSMYAKSSLIELELRARNPLAAIHAGNLWDLGDPASCVFEDLSIDVSTAKSPEGISWADRPDSPAVDGHGRDWALYQDSSGGEHWNSSNHIDAQGKPTVRFRGYTVSGPENRVLEEGLRATPRAIAIWANGWVAAATRDFWQNFPKALRGNANGLSVGLFPRESTGFFELQGGEQKRHTTWIEFGTPAMPVTMAGLQDPLDLSVSPDWIAGTGAVPYFSTPDRDRHDGFRRYLAAMLEGQDAFLQKREIIDEYGWRNFGDLYADHEAVNHPGDTPLISHYNNQYDFILGAATHFLRTGDWRWRHLMQDLARHVIDIDIYHTEGDRAAFNGGLFWHTDHYLDAKTSTHRTYSRGNGSGRSAGGGPSNEHNYTSGLLYYFFTTGDVDARASVLTLADWVLAMDDGSRTIFGIASTAPTGAASSTVSQDYHKPGRGAANSINALLDAYALSRDRPYMAKAEELIQRCIHPLDDIDALKLDQPEHRWSYLVFLQVLGKYLEVKREWGESDYPFFYARDSLLHYAQWMLENERPYKDVLHLVELPTETWPAQDIRKAHVLNLAAKYIKPESRAQYAQRATYFFDRCIADLLSFQTSHLTRPQVLIAVYGHVQTHFETAGHSMPDEARWLAERCYNYGMPVAFVGQRPGLKSCLLRKWRILRTEVARIAWGKTRSVLSGRTRVRKAADR